MMKGLIAGCLLVVITACGPSASSPETYNTEAAIAAMQLFQSIAEGRAVSDAAWEHVFREDGYRSYLSYSDSVYKKQLLKRTAALVFDPTKVSERDSLLALPIQLNRQGFELMLTHNLYALSKRMEEARQFLQNTDFANVLSQADSVARRNLPADIEVGFEVLKDVQFIISDADGKVTTHAIVVDVNTALEFGDKGLVNLIAHEFHHDYRALAFQPPTSALGSELNRLHQEGVADLIDKEVPPVTRMGLFPESVVELYNDLYVSTPYILQTLEEMVDEHIAGDLSREALDEKLRGYFKFGGHPNGYYMALLIKDELGMQPLFDTYDDPIAFVQLYNQVAAKRSEEHVFSDAFIEYAESNY